MINPEPKISDIIQPSVKGGYALNLFSEKELNRIQIFNKKGKYYLSRKASPNKYEVTKKW